MHNLRLSRLKAASGICLVALCLLVGGCATESHQTVAPQTVATYGSAYAGNRFVILVGRFQNRSTYRQGLFSDGPDELGNQAKTILKSDLKQTNRFTVVDRENSKIIAGEAAIRGEKQALKGAQVAISGDVTQFGRKVTGDEQLFGIFGAGKTQVAYATVALNVVDVRTSEIIYSVQGAGEYKLKNRQIIGFGGTSGYDATLNGKVLDLAITDAVNKLTAGMQAGAWAPTQ